MVWDVHIWFGAMLAAAGALLLYALASRQRMYVAATAFVAGASAQLGLTDPLWFGSLQLRPDSAFALLCYAVIVVQALIVAAILLPHARDSSLWAGVAALGRGRIILLFLLLLGSSAAPMGFIARHEYIVFAKQVMANAAFLTLNGANLLAFVMLVPEKSHATTAARVNQVLHEPGKDFPWFVACWVFVVTVAMSLLAFDRMPRVPDEVAYLFQARMLAQGDIFAPAPEGALAGALAYDWISILGGKWYSIFPPGWPALLALGIAIGAPFIINPLIAAITILVGYAFLSRWESPRIAALTILLLAVSPWYLAMGGSYMSHTLSLLLIVTAWLLMLTEGAKRLPAWFVAGGLLGWLFLTRPVEGLIIGVLTGFWALSRVDLRAVSGWFAVSIYGLGCLAVGALIFPYNHALTGDALLTPINQYFDLHWHPGANRLGFGADVGSPDNWGGVDIWPGHSPLEAVINAQFNLKALNVELLGWAAGSLLLLYVHLIWGRISRADSYMMIIAGLTIAAYALYWFNGGFYIGPRYWFLVLFPCLFLSARGLQTTTIILRERLGLPDGREKAVALLVLLTATAMVSFLSWRVAAKYWQFRGFHDVYRTWAATGNLDNSLIFITSDDMGEIGSGFIVNNPELTGPIFVRDRGKAANAAVMKHYPERKVLTTHGRHHPLEEGPPQ